MSSNVRRIAPYSPDANDIANAADQIKCVMAEIKVFITALKSDDCDAEVRKTVAVMLDMSHNDLDVARGWLEGHPNL
jgi:hypothetical protein